jgi:putative mRNA 3-end processing factor
MVGLNECYLKEGERLAPTRGIDQISAGESLKGELILAPPQSFGTRDLLRFGRFHTAFASGWMQGSNFRRYDRGFALSDHADWPSLLDSIERSRAKRVYVAHRDDHVLVKHLNDRGWKAALVGALAEQGGTA